MDPYKRFHSLLRARFFPLLRADGFAGSRPTFRRIKGERIDLINIQGSQYAGQCCVNVGVHFTFLPAVGGGLVADPRKLAQYDCVFRERLHEAAQSDHWWKYGENDAEADASVADLIDVYKRRGAIFFAKFEPFPAVFDRISPVELDLGDHSKMPGAMTTVTAALTMARIMNHLGRHDDCRQFAEVGLRHLGPASGLKRELERLRHRQS